jgi:cytochrome P450
MDVGGKIGQSSIGRISATKLSTLEWAFGKHGDIVIALVGIVTGLMFVVLFMTQRKKLRLPQGPRSLPIIGNIHQLGNNPHAFLWHQAKKYGPIMYLKLGSEGLVVASTAEAAREFVKVKDKVWAGRESSTGMDMFTYNHLDIVGASYGPYWLHLRKICTMELFTTKRLESFRPARTDEFNQMIKSIMDDVEQGKIVDLAMKLSHVALNNITRMLLNKRYPQFMYILYELLLK